MNVTFDTALKLMEAGFPQPIEDEVNTGRFWYQADGDMICYGFSVADYGEMATNKGCIFAPSATDILNELPGHKFALSKYTMKRKSYWACNESWIFPDERIRAYTTPIGVENPAEACALAWLEKNKK
jgi:hypothetical protein